VLQGESVLHRKCCLVVIEVDVDGTEFTLPFADAGGPGLERGLRVAALIGAARTMQVGEEWCDSVYLELDATSWRSRP